MQIQNLTQTLTKQEYIIHNIQYHLTVQRQRQPHSCIISAADNKQRIEQSYTEVPAPATGMCTIRPDKAFGMLWENKYGICIKANIIKWLKKMDSLCTIITRPIVR